MAILPDGNTIKRGLATPFGLSIIFGIAWLFLACIYIRLRKNDGDYNDCKGANSIITTSTNNNGNQKDIDSIKNSY